MRIKYNAPTVLTYTLVCALVVLLSNTLLPWLADEWFLVPGRGVFSPASFRDWITILTHAAGHVNWGHLVGNFSIILLIGPMLEENYGSIPLLIMILITSVITGLLNILFLPTGLMGASGAAFMMILLASFTNFSRGEIPITFILVLIFFLGEQFIRSFNTDNISHFAHIVGGFCGSLFGFFFPPGKRKESST